MSADTSAQPARTYSPTSKLPVASLSQPTVIGRMRPPRLPTELIPAIAVAAAVPLRNVEGSGQNGEAHFRCADRRLLAGDWQITSPTALDDSARGINAVTANCEDRKFVEG